MMLKEDSRTSSQDRKSLFKRFLSDDGTVTYEEFAKSSDQNDNQQMFAYFDVLDGRRDNRISRRKIAAALQQLYDLNCKCAPPALYLVLS